MIGEGGGGGVKFPENSEHDCKVQQFFNSRIQNYQTRNEMCMLIGRFLSQRCSQPMRKHLAWRVGYLKACSREDSNQNKFAKVVWFEYFGYFFGKNTNKNQHNMVHILQRVDADKEHKVYEIDRLQV